jgi:hypothetical protein
MYYGLDRSDLEYGDQVLYTYTHTYIHSFTDPFTGPDIELVRY